MVQQRSIFCLSRAHAPVLHWRTNPRARYRATPMEPSFQGGWVAPVAAGWGEKVQFYLEDAHRRGPDTGCWETSTAETFVKDGQVYSYRPAPEIEPARRDYDPRRPFQLKSKILGEDRNVRIYLPRGYRQHTEHHYPVLYMKDGQNIFERGAFGTWNAQASLDRLSARGEIQEIIVVAVDHGVGRFQDYVPPEDGGKADRYAQFLVSELKPWVDNHYRTLSGPADTGILGSSLGGVAALYTAWNHSHVFGKVASMSGSWWLKSWRDRLSRQGKRPLRCYIDSGDSGYARDCVHHTVTLGGLLRGIGFSHDLLHHVEKGHTHTESAWGQRLEKPLKFLFPAA